MNGVIGEVVSNGYKNQIRNDIMFRVCFGFKKAKINKVKGLTLPADQFVLENGITSLGKLIGLDAEFDCVEGDRNTFSEGIKRRPVNCRYGNVDFSELYTHKFSDEHGWLIPKTGEERDYPFTKGMYNFIWDDRMCSLNEDTVSLAVTALENMSKGMYFVTWVGQVRCKERSKFLKHYIGTKDVSSFPQKFLKVVKADLRQDKGINLIYIGNYSGAGNTPMTVVGISKNIPVEMTKERYKHDAFEDYNIRANTSHRIKLNLKTKFVDYSLRQKSLWHYVKVG